MKETRPKSALEKYGLCLDSHKNEIILGNVLYFTEKTGLTLVVMF